jgi:hypothetical protein
MLSPHVRAGHRRVTAVGAPPAQHDGGSSLSHHKAPAKNPAAHGCVLPHRAAADCPGAGLEHPLEGTAATAGAPGHRIVAACRTGSTTTMGRPTHQRLSDGAASLPWCMCGR